MLLIKTSRQSTEQKSICSSGSQSDRATDDNSINSRSLVILEDQRSADQRRQFLSQNAGYRSWTEVAPEPLSLGYGKGGSAGGRQQSSLVGNREAMGICFCLQHGSLPHTSGAVKLALTLNVTHSKATS